MSLRETVKCIDDGLVLHPRARAIIGSGAKHLIAYETGPFNSDRGHDGLPEMPAWRRREPTGPLGTCSREWIRGWKAERYDESILEDDAIRAMHDADEEPTFCVLDWKGAELPTPDDARSLRPCNEWVFSVGDRLDAATYTRLDNAGYVKRLLELFEPTPLVRDVNPEEHGRGSSDTDLPQLDRHLAFFDPKQTGPDGMPL